MPDIQVVLNQTLYSQQVRNVLHFFYDAALTEETMQDIADSIRLAWADSDLAALQVNNWRMSSVSIRPCGSTGPHALIPFTLGDIIGQNVSQETVSQVAMLVSLRNNGFVPPTRGRIYLAGIATTFIDNEGQWVTTALDEPAALVASLLDLETIAENFLSLRIASRNANGTCDVLNVVNNAQVQPVPATQRRRRLGVGA